MIKGGAYGRWLMDYSFDKVKGRRSEIGQTVLTTINTQLYKLEMIYF